ncbi:OmpW/AlkL family protein [Methylobacterium sp. JK268]
MRTLTASILLAGMLAAAQAADLAPEAAPAPSAIPPWRPLYLRVGAAGIWFDASAKVSVSGVRIPGGTARVKDNVAVIAEAGYHLTPNWSAALSVGIPPTTTLSGAGTLRSAGKLGDVTYGPAVISARYHLTGLGPIVPYLGGGVAYAMIFNTHDRALRTVKVDDNFGAVLVGGVDIPVTDRIGLFVDVKKFWLSADASFDQPAGNGLFRPGRARVTLDPVVLSAGVALRF